MRAILSATLLAAAVLLCGCKVDGGGSFNPTALGYSTAHTTLNAVYGSITELNTMLRLDDYISAEDEAVRTEIHDKYFYSQRIVERTAGEWHIISPGNETVVATGSRPLREPGARWSCSNTSETVETVIENMSGDDGESYSLYSEHGKESYGTLSVMELTVGLTTDTTPVRREVVTVAGRGEVYRYSGDFTFTILAPLTFDTSKERFTGGRMMMTSVADGVTYSPEAEISERYITIRGGLDNAYVKDYPYNGYY